MNVYFLTGPNYDQRTKKSVFFYFLLSTFTVPETAISLEEKELFDGKCGCCVFYVVRNES